MKITIIVPSYNCEEYLKQTLQSIEEQTYNNIQLIVIDNESTDNSYEIVKQHKSRFEYHFDSVPNIYKYSWEEPVQKAFELLSGDWFTIVGADDILDPIYIENYSKILSRLGLKYKAFQSPCKTFGANKDRLAHKYNSMDEFKQLYLQKCPVITPTVFYKKELIKDYIPCSKEYLGACDYFIYGHLATLGIYIFPIPIELGYNYRVHDNQATWKMIELGFDKKIQTHWRNIWQM